MFVIVAVVPLSHSVCYHLAAADVNTSGGLQPLISADPRPRLPRTRDDRHAGSVTGLWIKSSTTCSRNGMMSGSFS